MRFGDPAHPRDRGFVIEHDTAAAVDLQIDKAGRDYATLQPVLAISLGHGLRNSLANTVFGQQHAIFVQRRAVEDRRPGVSFARHTVSVTLRK